MEEPFARANGEPLRCGLYMAAKKRPKFDGFVEYASSQGVEFVDLDLNDDASTDPPTNLHAILHKVPLHPGSPFALSPRSHSLAGHPPDRAPHVV